MSSVQASKELQQTHSNSGNTLSGIQAKTQHDQQAMQPEDVMPEDAKTHTQQLKTWDGFALDDKGRLNNYPVTPPTYMQNKRRFGFTPYAEIVNGRAAMIGFVLLLMIEFFAGQSFISIVT